MLWKKMENEVMGFLENEQELKRQHIPYWMPTPDSSLDHGKCAMA